MRKEFIALLCMVGMVSAMRGPNMHMMATPNATIYLDAELGKTTSYIITIFGTNDTSPLNVSLMFDGEIKKYATTQDMIQMKANPTNTIIWYPIILNITLPDDESLAGKEIYGKLFAVVKQCSGSETGSCQEFAAMKYLVLRPKEAEKVISPENKTFSENKPTTQGTNL
jgi:hypothetical protein